MLDPIGGYLNIKNLLISQIETTQRMRDSKLQALRKSLLIDTDTLSNSPILEPVPRYKTAEYSLEDLLTVEPNPLADFTIQERSLFINLTLSGLFDGKPIDNNKYLTRRSIYKPYLHQMQMLEKGVKPGLPGVVTSGTGSGKTESFMLPILATISKEALKWPKPLKSLAGNKWFENSNTFHLQRDFEHPARPKAVRALILYPMNALVEDQLTRLRKTLSSPEALDVLDNQANGNRIYFGRYTSKSPVTGFLNHPRLKDNPDELKLKKKRIQKLKDELNITQKYYENARSFDERTSDKSEKNQYLFPNVLGSELVSRWDMQETPPDILVTNTSMLSIMLSREVDQGVFENTKKWLMSDPEAYFFLVLDELHLIRGSSGTEVAGLIRYLIHRLGLDQPEHRHKLRILASSASLPTNGDLANESLNYLTDFFGYNGLYTDAFSKPDLSSWLETIVKGEQIGFDRVADQLNPIHFENFTDDFLKIDLDYSIFKTKNNDVEKNEYLKFVFEPILSGIYRVLNLSEEKFIDNLKKLILYSSNLINSCCFDNNENIIKPQNLKKLSKSIFGVENLKALRGLLIIRGLNDLLPVSLRLESLPSLRIHTFFKSLEGLYAAPYMTETGISFVPNSLTTDRGQYLIQTGQGIQRNFEWLVCEACGELFIGGQKRKDNAAQISISTTGFNLEELPEKATDTLYEKLTVDQYAIFFPTNNAEAIKDPIWKPKFLDARNGILFNKQKSSEDIPGFYFEPKDQDTIERAGGALPVKCPCCLTNYQGRIYHKIQPASPIRSFRSGFAKTSQLLATQLFSFLNHSSGEAKTIVFSDSRQDAARAALNIESLHHQDLRRLLLVKAIQKKLENKDNGIDIEKVKLEQAEALRTANIDLIIKTQELIKQYEDKQKTKRVSLNELIEIEDGFNVSPFLSSLITLGVHPSDSSGIEKINNQPWWEWFNWENSLTPRWKFGSNDGAGANFKARQKIRENVNELTYEVLFSKTTYAFEESGLGWVGVQSTDGEESLKLDAWLRVLADSYRVRGSKYFDEESQMPYTRASDIRQQSNLFKFAKSLDVNNPVRLLDDVIHKFDQLGHTGLSVDLERLYIHPTSANDPYYRCSKCGRVHLHKGVGHCTRCFDALPMEPTGQVSELWNTHYLALKVHQSLDDDIFRLHCEELTGQTSDPAQRLQHFKGIFIDEDENQKFDVIKKKAQEIDLLSVTTTMEVGIDIGALQAVYQANMPPQRFNYQQRVGRAGRRGQSYSMIVTLCRNKSHDTYYYENPEAITADPPPPPFLSFDLLQVHKRIVNKVWLTYAFDLIKNRYLESGNDYPGDYVKGSTHGDFPYANEIYSMPEWKKRLEDALRYTESLKNSFVKAMLETNLSLSNVLEDYSVDDLVTLIYKSSEEGKKSNKSFGEFLANKGILPLYGMPSNVREFYLGISEKNELFSVDRDAETAIYEFAPNQTLVVDKKTYQSKGFVPSLYLPPFGHTIKKSSDDENSWFYESYLIAKCPQCSAINLKQVEKFHKCHNCGVTLLDQQFKQYVDPTAYISSGENLSKKEIDELEIQHFDRIVTLINEPTIFNPIISSNLSIGNSEDNGTSVLRLNEGVSGEGEGKKGFTLFDKEKIALSVPRGKPFWLENIKYISKYPGEKTSNLGLATLKKTDGIYLKPKKIANYFDFSYLGRSKDAIAIRSGLVSATQILIQRAALELDIAPEEFEQIEPRLIEGLPVLQICDQLANGAGFSQRLSEDTHDSGSPLILKLIESVLFDDEDLLGIKFKTYKHKTSCFIACYKCIQRYGNRAYHGLLDWRLGIAFLRLLYDPQYKCGLDGNFNFLELENWYDQVERSLANVKMFKPAVYTTPKLVDMDGLKLWSIQDLQSEKIYYVIHPFWSQVFILEKYKDYLKGDFEFVNSFEVLHMPQNKF
ncbi:DEAD/DEAH box helicase [Acinetobacter sp. NS4_7]